MNDFDLLREYAGRASEDAFTLLVNRYVNLVYSAAFRQAGDARDAEEITQAVFLILARKAGGMRPDTVLPGWLLRTTRFVAFNARRREISRRQLEREAMNLYSTETDAAWKKISPMLDEALVNLSEKDRAAVALRFFDNKSYKEIGQAMGLTEDGAQKRVSRAVDKLRADFARRGLALPVALITGAIMAGAVQAAPSHLAASVASAAFAGTAATANALAKITLSAWEAARLKLLALQGAAVTMVVAVIWLTAVQLNSGNVQPSAPAGGAAPVVAGGGTALAPGVIKPVRAEPAEMATKTADFSGIVQMPDGEPVAGAIAILCTEEPRRAPVQRALRGGGSPQPGQQSGGSMSIPGQFDLSSKHVETDAQGRFSIPPEEGLKRILFFTASGFASLSPEQLAASPIVTLLPWGRITGVLKIGSQPGANETIELYYLQETYDEWSGYGVFLETKTDAEGRFGFEGVPPGELRIAHRLSFRDGQSGAIPITQQTHIQVQAGETTQVTMGGTGWKVVGRLKLKALERFVDWKLNTQWMDTKTPAPPAPDRKNFASAVDYEDAVLRWHENARAFWASEAGRQARQLQRRYALEFDADGSFKMDDVVPGTYELLILILGRELSDGAPQVPGPLKAIVHLTKEIVIPEITAGADGSAFDLGELQLN